MAEDDRSLQVNSFHTHLHVNYFRAMLHSLPLEYLEMDTSRMTVLYFCIIGLDILTGDVLALSFSLTYFFTHLLTDLTYPIALLLTHSLIHSLIRHFTLILTNILLGKCMYWRSYEAKYRSIYLFHEIKI